MDRVEGCVKNDVSIFRNKRVPFVEQSQEERRLLGELYIDATAHRYTGASAVVFGHYMGMVFSRPNLTTGSAELVQTPIAGDRPYYRTGIPLWTDDEG